MYKVVMYVPKGMHLDHSCCIYSASYNFPRTGFSIAYDYCMLWRIPLKLVMKTSNKRHQINSIVKLFNNAEYLATTNDCSLKMGRL